MDLYAQLIVNTLQIGAVYVLFSLGLTLIYGVMKIINFAHGEFFSLAALCVSVVTLWVEQTIGTPVWVAYLIAFLCGLSVVTLLGAILYKFGFQRFQRDLIGSFILSLGIVLLLQGIFVETFGAIPRTVPSVIPGQISLFGANITTQRLVVCGIAILFTAGLYAIIVRTKLGKALRAVAEDRDAAMLQGIPYRRVSMIGFIIGSLLAAIAGGLMAPLVTVSPVIGSDFIIKAFIIIVIGGLGSIPGTIIAGFLIALIESVGGFYFDPSLATIAMFVLIMIFLLFQPQGLMGHAES